MAVGAGHTALGMQPVGVQLVFRVLRLQHRRTGLAVLEVREANILIVLVLVIDLHALAQVLAVRPWEDHAPVVAQEVSMSAADSLLAMVAIKAIGPGGRAADFQARNWSAR
jgi:hypothetical protein